MLFVSKFMRNFMIHTLRSILQIALHTQTTEDLLNTHCSWSSLNTYFSGSSTVSTSHLLRVRNQNPSGAYQIHIFRCLDPNSLSIILKIGMLNFFLFFFPCFLSLLWTFQSIVESEGLKMEQ